MKKILFIFCAFLIYVNGQSQSATYKKNIRFNSPINLEDAKKIFIQEFHLDDDNSLLEIKRNKSKNLNHIKYQQYYKGIKVEYGIIIAHLKDGKVTSINGELYNPKSLEINTNLSSEAALNKAMVAVNAEKYMWEDKNLSKVNNYKKPEESPIILPIIDNDKYILRMAYKLDIYALKPISRAYVYVDANTGSILFHQNIIKHLTSYNSNTHNITTGTKFDENLILVSGQAHTRYSGVQAIETRAENNGTFTLHDDTRNIHTYNAQNSPTDGTYQFTSVDFVDNDNNWTSTEFNNAAKDNAALDAHWGAIKVHEFWSSLGRNSYNDAGAPIRSYVHVGTNYFNAFWNGSVMSYGDGNPNPLTGIDVVSHEIAHAVTTWTADLVYARESGALNEGFSDIFGAAVEYMAKGTGPDTNPNPETWLIGEDFTSPLRSMSNPKSKGDPDTYNGINYIDATSNCIPEYGPTGNDGCGVHRNSGVLNHWFYVLVVGKTGTNDAGDNYNVSGIGMNKAQEIAYLTLRDYLTPNSTFMDTRDAAIEVATQLYGSHSPERKATQDAFYAVNLGDKYVPIPKDLNLVEFVDLTDISCGETITPIIKVRNSGVSDIINSITINYSIDGAAAAPFVWNGILNVNQEANISLPDINRTTVKSYKLEVQSIVTGDGDPTNNSLVGTFRINKSNNSPTVINNFESPLNDYWLSYNEDNTPNLWVIGIPNKSKLNSATSGTRGYVTNPNTNYPNDKKSYLVTPCYNLSTIVNPVIKFNMAFELQQNYDILYMEYSTDLKNWNILGSAEDANWYNSDRIFESPEISSDCQNCPGAQWTGSSSGFKQYSYNLNELKSNPNINFRFVFHSNSTITDEGVVIDDFVIEDVALSTNDYDLNNTINIYPNPSKTGIFTITNKNGTLRDTSLNIYEINGKHLLKQFDIFKNGIFNLDLSTYSKGMYFIRLKSDNKISTHKIVIH